MIDSLTPQQEQDLIAFREHHLAIGRSTEPADRPTTEAVLKQMYAAINEPQPYIWWCNGPCTGSLVRSLIRSLGANLRDNLWANLRDNLWDNLRDNLGANLWANLRDNLWTNLRDNLGANLRDNLWDNLWANLRDNLGANLRDNLWANLRDNLRDNLWANLWDNLWDNLRDNLGANLHWNFWGSHENYWPPFYDFSQKVLGITYNTQDAKTLSWWLSLSASCGWWQPFKGIVFVCERPAVQTVDDRGFLHNETGPALLCRDGWAIHAWHGVTVKPHVIEQPESITLEEIEKENNTEIKRVLTERFGWERFLHASQALRLHRRFNDRDGQWEELYQTKAGSNRIILIDPSTGRRYVLGVPREITTCEQAQQWMHHDLDTFAIHRS